VGRENPAHVRFEIGEQIGRNIIGRAASRFGKKFAKGAALINSQGRDDAAISGKGREALLFSR